jgi:branched-chain amino acid transport system ATP-binding protein
MTIGIRKEFDFFFTEGLSKRFGGVAAVSDFSLELTARSIVGLIGPNGAGKTTVFNLITGMDQPDAGEIYFRQQYITREPAHRIAMLGIARTFQNIRLLGHLSVLDNVKVAYHAHIRYNFVEAALRLPRYHRVEKDIAAKSMEFLDLFGLTHEAGSLASSLPYGLRRKLEIARALATGASLLLLDEPGAGLNPAESAELARLIRLLRDDFGVTILLIEHDMKMVMSLCDRIVALNFGRIIAQGEPDEVKNNPAVIEAYLGRLSRAATDGTKWDPESK